MVTTLIHLADKEILDKFRHLETRNAAFSELVHKYQQKIYWHIRKMVIDHEDANDLTQETFIKAWKKLESFNGDSQLYTWLYRIATNDCLRFLQKKKRRFFLPLVNVQAQLLIKLENSNLVTADEIQLKLQKALLTLPNKQRLVFNMKYFDDMKYEDISAIMGTSVGALKASYHLAVKKIEFFLEGN
jgi:RNA polymerase sigma-70 factor (ECF subfamily)